ncbi:hypothetical protein [Plantactinospora sp. GCM10030261]|uniref:hypothetical protein n=1 Tax=Plantactinospora sp. GCM10030261 TaxID=3273420 RepID=UPI003611678A
MTSSPESERPTPRPGPPPGGPRPDPPRPGPPPGSEPAASPDGGAANVEARHPAVDAAVRGIANAADLSPADQIAQYEAAHRILRETLASIDQT